MGLEAVKRALPRTFAAFFGRFDRLNPVQVEAIPLLIEGTDLLICAPTASGKTEAFAAPAAELVLQSPRGLLRVIIVSPTRALANDLKRRLEGRFGDLGIGLGRYTGEHKERTGGDLPEVTITTPEALDSLLARRAASLASVRMVVCEEIHVLDNTPRGDQLRILLHRLESRARHRPQRVVTSATIDGPREMACRYLDKGKVVEVGGARRVLGRCFPGRGPAAMANHLSYLTQHGFRKILVFCNRRADVETLTAKLTGRCVFDQAVFPHHGSLSRTVRERTERRFNEAPAAVAFATMTLELGIDIGTVDYVLLDGPPPDVSSLLQRLGRGGRRTTASRVGCAVEDGGGRLIFKVLLRAGVRGHLLAPPYALRPGVIVQQAFVLAGAKSWVDARRLEAAIPAAIWADVAPIGPRDILEALVDPKLLERPRSGRYVPTELLERRYRNGVLHSNIDSGSVTEIVDRLTGETIGQIAGSDMPRLRLGGRGRKVIKGDAARLLTDPVGRAATAHFASRASWICSQAQAQAVVHALGVAEGQIDQIPLAGSTILLHGLGTIGAFWLTQLIEKSMGSRAVEWESPYTHRFTRPLESLPRPTEEDALAFVANHERRLATLLAMGPWHARLPAELRRQALYKAAGLGTLVESLREPRLVTVTDRSRHDIEAALQL